MFVDCLLSVAWCVLFVVVNKNGLMCVVCCVLNVACCVPQSYVIRCAWFDVCYVVLVVRWTRLLYLLVEGRCWLCVVLGFVVCCLLCCVVRVDCCLWFVV